jgi:hypothetical protein
MKKYVVTASLIAGLSMVSGAAFAQTSGTVGVNYSHVDAGGDADAYGVSGGVTIPTGGSLAVLLDGSYSKNDDYNIDTLTGTAHLITRDDSRAWGGFVGLSNVDTGGSDYDAWGVGGEYAKFFTGSTLAFTVGYASIDDLDADAVGVLGEYRIFATDNLRFDIGAGWAKVDTGFGDDDGTEIGAGVEYRFNGAPVSLGANVSHIDSGGSNVDYIGASLRFDFGNGSLKERDRKGNTFGGLSGLSSFFQ